MTVEDLVVAGLDVSTDPRKTWWAEVSWDGTTARLEGLDGGLGPTGVVDRLTTGDFTTAAVDVPFGWPAAFSRLVRLHAVGALPGDILVSHEVALPTGWYEEHQQRAWRTGEVAHRLTDRYLTHLLATGYGCRRTPLSAAFDRLGATTAMWALIEAHLAQRHGWSTDRAGYRDRAATRTVIETYPAGQLAVWGSTQRAKPTWLEFVELFGGLDITKYEGQLTTSDDARDAVICSVVALAHATRNGLIGPRSASVVEWMTGRAEEQIQAEGWIWITETPVARLLAPG